MTPYEKLAADNARLEKRITVLEAQVRALTPDRNAAPMRTGNSNLHASRLREGKATTEQLRLQSLGEWPGGG